MRPKVVASMPVVRQAKLLIALGDMAELYDVDPDSGLQGEVIVPKGKDLMIPRARCKRFAMRGGGDLYVVGIEWPAYVTLEEAQQVRTNVAQFDLFSSPQTQETPLLKWVPLVLMVIMTFMSFSIMQNIGKVDSILLLLGKK